MEIKTMARIGACAFAAAAISLTAIDMRAERRASPDPVAGTPRARTDDPLLAEMLRCQSIGLAAASDRACLQAWAENRRRFLAPGSLPEMTLPKGTPERPGASVGADVDPVAPHREAAPAMPEEER